MTKFVVKLPFASMSKKLQKKKRPGSLAERVRKFRERFKTDSKLNKRTKMALHRPPDYQRSLSQLAFRFNIDFQDGSYVGFPIRMISAIFDLPVNSILPMKFQVNCPFGSGEKVQNKFSIGLLGRPFGFLIRMISLF